ALIRLMPALPHSLRVLSQPAPSISQTASGLIFDFGSTGWGGGGGGLAAGGAGFAAGAGVALVVAAWAGVSLGVLIEVQAAPARNSTNDTAMAGPWGASDGIFLPSQPPVGGHIRKTLASISPAVMRSL